MRYEEPYDEQQAINKERRGCFPYAVVAVVVLLSMLWMCSCAKRVITNERIVYRDSIIKQTEYMRDSVYINDSTIIKEKGDTIFIEKIKKVYKDRWRDRTDTIYINKGDTITETIVKQVVPKWCWWLLLIVCGYVAFRVIKWKIK